MGDTTAVEKLHPPTKWAQRADTIFITVSVEDIEKEKQELKVDDDRFFFHCKGGHEHHVYELDIKFYKEVESSSLRLNRTDRELTFALKKKEPGTPFWPRLHETSVKQHWLKVDFSRWKDEDDSDIEEDGSFEDMMRKMGGGVPQDDLEGLNDEEDSDDGELPDLE
ncbi:prostaglandin E synthase 3-like [Acanthaster planci]|uniref:Prostaglandin E synthase 3-like n=1 Tax=Acanthaster planci TaxID=133434 RepID=A0A8B7XI39_ACAPL|nr:prostaglandin E synthase 3-like [Acanthaster planci]